MGVVEVKLNPSRRDVIVFALLCVVFLPMLGWVLPAVGSNLLIVAGVVTALWLCAAVFDSERPASEKAFGVLIPVVLLAIWGGLRAGEASGLDDATLRRWSLAVMGVIGLILCVVAPASEAWGSAIYRVWMLAALPIGWTVSHLLLGLVYFGVVTPIGVLRRRIGGDAMCRAFDPKAKTYWMPHEQTQDSKRYFRQF